MRALIIEDDQTIAEFVARGLRVSMIKHSLLLLLGILCVAVAYGAPVGWELLLEAALFGWLTMLLSTYVLAPLLYRKTSGHWLLPLAPVLRVCAILVLPIRQPLQTRPICPRRSRR